MWVKLLHCKPGIWILSVGLCWQRQEDVHVGKSMSVLNLVQSLLLNFETCLMLVPDLFWRLADIPTNIMDLHGFSDKAP